ncbi:MAG: hypothetical protein GWO38_27250 [Phycisphaerae bacterium]|nr:hypothetical protein [Phycisphaerae bacterium]NIX01485.1 hypothetical protein [Phycisphaerae bacterium]NIX31222.1 hypothetical protein [Phycisphaerae bacterium]
MPRENRGQRFDFTGHERYPGTGLIYAGARYYDPVRGSNIKVYVDGDLEIDYNDSSYSSGYFGFNVFGVFARYDNLVVKSDNVPDYIRGAEGEVLAEYDVGDNLQKEYVYARSNQRIASISSATGTDIYLNDHPDSLRSRDKF